MICFFTCFFMNAATPECLHGAGKWQTDRPNLCLHGPYVLVNHTSPYSHSKNHVGKCAIFLLNFFIGIYPLNNIMIVSDEQQRDSAIYTHVSILPQTPLPSRLTYNTEQSSMYDTGGPF